MRKEEEGKEEEEEAGGLTLDAKSLHAICETPLSSPSLHLPPQKVVPVSVGVYICVKVIVCVCVCVLKRKKTCVKYCLCG